jgi:methionyl-tRNA formyltransferase
MRIIVFASPGIVGPFVLGTLIHLKENVLRLVLPNSHHSVSDEELRSIAASASIPISQPVKMSDSLFYEELCADDPDLIIVATYDRLIPRSILSLARIAAINIHPSLLPKYRGPCPEFWAVRNGEDETGVTIHYLDDEFDTGDIIMQEPIPINPSDTLGMVLYRFASTAARMVVKLLDLLQKEETLFSVPQDAREASLAPFVNSDDLRIDWTQPTKSMYDLVRAANPLGGAWTTFRGFQLKIWHAEIAPTSISTIKRAAGSLYLDQQTEKIYIRARDGFIELKAVQQALYYILDGWSFVQKAFVKDDESFV